MIHRRQSRRWNIRGVRLSTVCVPPSDHRSRCRHSPPSVSGIRIQQIAFGS